MTSLIGETGKADVAYSIENFLATPRRVDQFDWLTTDAPGAEIVSLDFPNTTFSTGMTQRKVADFRFFRPNNLHLKFVINANKFSVGKLMCVWEPMPDLKGWFAPANELTLWSGYPCIYIDAATMPEVEWKIPFVSHNLQYDLLNDTYQYGRLRVLVLNSLKNSVGSASAHITIYTWCTDVQLSVRTINVDGFVPAAPLVKEKERWKMQASEAVQTNTKGTISGVKGPISRTAEKVSKFGTVVKDVGAFTGIAPVTALGAAAEWVGKITARAASIFGYSKVQDQRMTQCMVQIPGRGYTNVNGAVSGVVLAADAENSLSIDQTVLGDAHDPMDINRICSKEAFLKTYTWSETDVEGTVICSFPVAPGQCGVPTGMPVAQNVCPTPMAYVASMFQYWRGDIDYRLSFVANDFYAGRIGVAFLSGIYSTTNPVDLNTIESAPKIICDVQSSKECSFSIDFANFKPWLHVQLWSPSSTDSWLNKNLVLDPDNSLGLVVVYVINPLRRPDSVPSSIDVNLFTKGRNMEFANPSMFYYTFVYPEYTPPPLVESKKGKDIDGFVKIDPSVFKKKRSKYQMQGINVLEPSQAQGMETNPHSIVSTDSSKMSPSALCIGESITNLRALTRRFGKEGEHIIPSGSAAFLDPAFMGAQTTVVPLWAVGGLFCFFRGGIRYQVFLVEQTVGGAQYVPHTRVFLNAGTGAPDEAVDIQVYGDVWTANMEHTVNNSLTPIMDFTVPFYRPTASRFRTSQATGDLRPIAVLRPFVQGGSQTVQVYVAGADDFSFGYQIGPPYITNRL